MTLQSQRDTFDLVPGLYEKIRPAYPVSILEDVEAWARLNADSRVLDVGMGTGKATEYFAKRGYSVLGIEVGINMASFARRKFAVHPRVSVETASFEEWRPGENLFDLLLSAQAFHWIDPALGASKSASILRLGGAVALLWNLDISQGTEFWRRGTPIHDKYLAPDPDTPLLPLDHQVKVYQKALEADTSFADFERLQQEWAREYTADQWIQMRNTFSPDLKMAPSLRSQFHRELRTLIDELGGRITRHYRTVAIMARRTA